MGSGSESDTEIATSAPPTRLVETRFTPGTIIGNRYRIVSLLGKGGMGEVYRADDMKLGQRVALKCLPPELTQNAVALERLCAEVRIGRQISHPNVCRIYDIVELDQHHFIAMEYIDGEDLASLLRRIGRLPPEKAVSIARDICAGVAAAHDRGIIHRDLKPANIMVDGCGRAVVADFGLAALGEDLRGVRSTSGTPAYMSPEQFTGARVTARTDIYSLGLILYEIFTGRRVYAGATLDEIREMHAMAKSRPSSLVKEIDPIVERMILRCMEEDPAQRIGSVHALIGALPGGDALSAAVAAGETPAPDVVAAAGVTGELSNTAAWSLCMAAMAAILLGAWISSKFTVIGMVSDMKSRDALADRARDVVRAFGYPKPYDETVEFVSNRPFLTSVASKSGADKWSKADDSSVSPLHLVYRGSPVALVPRDIDGLVGPADPPETIENMSTIVLDHRGRLRSFRSVPPDRIAATGAAFDWRRAFDLAELDIRTFRPVAPVWTPPYGFDQRMAWSGTYPDRKDIAIRVEAASLAGKPVFFRVIEPWMTPLSSPSRPPLGYLTFGIMTFIASVGGAAIALRNLRRGRGDRRGALRIGLVMVASAFLTRVCWAHHVTDFRAEWDQLMQMLAISLLRGVTVAILYLAVEPYVRRQAPRLLIAWSRLVAGRLRDPLLGRDVMIGGVAAGLTVTISRAAVPLSAWLGRGKVLPLNPLNAYGMRTALGSVCSISQGIMLALITTIVMLALIVIFALITRSYIAAVFVTILAVATTTVTGNVPLVVNVAQLAITVFVLYRFGAVAFAACTFLRNAMFYTPFTLDLSAWYAPRGVGVLLLIVGLLVAAMHTSLAGKPLFRDAILEEQPAA